MDDRYKIPRTKAVERVVFTENYVTGKDILHVGVGGAIYDDKLKDKFLKTDISNWFHSRITKKSKSITTLELVQDNIDKFSELIPGNYVLGDIMDPKISEKLEKYELIVFTEILEHINDFDTALTSMKKMLKPGGQILISTINAYNIFNVLKLFRRIESNHIEHTSYFSYLTMKQLLKMSGLKIDEFYFAYDHRKNPITRLIKGPVHKLFPQFSQGLLLLASSNESDA